MDYIKILEGKVRACIKKYSMINDGDSVCVALSGGADSVMLLYLLAKIQKYTTEKFALSAMSVDMGFENADYDTCREFCEKLGVEYKIVKTEIKQVIVNSENPCSLCSKMRRRVLCENAREMHVNTLALGHNEDDSAQTLLMNLLYGGNFISFSPMTDYGDLKIVRPLLSCSQKLIRTGIKQLDAPIMKSPCPMDKNTRREDIKKMIELTDRDCRGTAHRLVRSLEKNNIDGYKS